MATTASVGPQSITPSKKGWHLVLFQNGDSGFFRWNGNSWEFGGSNPHSPVVGFTFLASNVADLAYAGERLGNGIAQWEKAGWHFPSALIHGILSVENSGGQPLLVTSSGVVQGTGAEQTSPNPENAPSAGINIPNPIGSVTNFLSVLGNIQFWKGLGLVIAGAVVLFFAGKEFMALA